MNKNTITFKKKHLESFYNFSRDKNPLHLDSQYAALIIPVSKSISDQTNINNLHNYLSSPVETIEKVIEYYLSFKGKKCFFNFNLINQ